MAERHKAPTYNLEPHKQRIMESLLYLISEADCRKIPVTQYSLLKALFLADKAHLNKFGRPITYDNYVAMNHGPVPRFAYNLLKNEVDLMDVYGVKGSLWDKRRAPEISESAYCFTNASRKANLDLLSESDLEALSQSLTVVNSLSFAQLRMLTHGDPAYIDAWNDESDKKSFPMSYALIFDTPDYDQAESIALASKHS